MPRGALPESTVTHNSVSGQKIVSAYAPVAGGWTAGVAADATRLVIGPGSLLFTSILAALAILGSLLLSFVNGRALTRQVRELKSKTKNVTRGVPIVTTPPAFVSLTASSLGQSLRNAHAANRATSSNRQELRSREEHFRLLADSVPQLVWTAGRDGQIEYTNARREKYGAIGRTDWEGIIHPDDRRATAEAWLRASEARVPLRNGAPAVCDR